MPQYLTEFLSDETGQDLTEYTLIITFLVITMFALVSIFMPYINALWLTGNSHLQTANTSAS